MWVDHRGYKRASLIRNEDPDEMAEHGIPLQPPDLDLIDWEGVRRDIHNDLVDRGLFDWADVVRAQNGLAAVIAGPIRRRLIMLYRSRNGAGEDTANE